LLEPSAQGLRPIDQKNVAAIRKSVEDYGLQDHSPILVDDRGRVLAGRHRLEVEKQLGITWPRKALGKLDNWQAVSIAMSSNITRPWSADDYKRLGKQGLGSGKSATQRQVITLALLENHERSNKGLGRIVGCDEITVAAVRMTLEDGKWIPARSRLNPNRAGLVVAKLIAENPDMPQAEIARMAGCTASVVSAVTHSRSRNSALRSSGVPTNIRQALIDNPTLNHTAIAQKIGVSPNRLPKYCARIVAEGVYAKCEHHQRQDGNPAAHGWARSMQLESPNSSPRMRGYGHG
jgi:hypothetical protein